MQPKYPVSQADKDKIYELLGHPCFSDEERTATGHWWRSGKANPDSARRLIKKCEGRIEQWQNAAKNWGVTSHTAFGVAPQDYAAGKKIDRRADIFHRAGRSQWGNDEGVIQA